MGIRDEDRELARKWYNTPGYGDERDIDDLVDLLSQVRKDAVRRVKAKIRQKKEKLSKARGYSRKGRNR